MAATSANMSLKQWNVGGDFFSYSELSDNWGLVDVHDHSSGKGVQIPTGGLANLAVTTAKIASNAIDVNKIADNAVTNAKLYSSPNGIYRTVLERSAIWNSSGSDPVFLGVRSTSGAEEDDVPFHTGRAFYFDPADYAVTGMTTKIRLRGFIVTDTTAPSTNFTFRLSTIVSTAAFVGGIGATTLSASAISADSGNTLYQTTSADLTAPAAGWYVLCCSSGTAQRVAGTAQLQLRHV